MHPNAVLHDCFSHGDMTSIAALIGCSVQHVSAYCSEGGPPSPHASYIAWLHVINSVNSAAARKIADDLQVRLDEWSNLRRGARRAPATLSNLAGGIVKETSELVMDRLAEVPERRQRQEALEVIEAAQRFIRGLDDAEESQSLKAVGGK